MDAMSGTMDSDLWLPDGHRDRLVATIRAAAYWCREKAHEYPQRQDRAQAVGALLHRAEGAREVR